MTFLFWNLMGARQESRAARHARLRTHILRMASSFGVDVFMFAESAFEPADLTDSLSRTGAGMYLCGDDQRHADQPNRIQILSRLDPPAFATEYDSDDRRLTIRRLRTPSTSILLAVIHFQSQAHWTPHDQALQATVVGSNISQTEDTVGHQRTVLVGDLNMNPFDVGVVGAQTLNAVMTRDLARRPERTVANTSYRFFYNPMWGHFGDRTTGPPGTFFSAASNPVNFFWNMLDQVLLRPELMDALEELRILDTDGENSLVTERGRPWAAEASDHLPILFRLKI